MKRTAVIVMAIVLALWLGGVVLVAAVQSRPTPAGDGMVRHATPRVLFGRQNSHISLNQAIQSAAECAMRPDDVRVVLLLDRSGSMAQGNAFTEALGAARRFIDSVDLAAMQLAIVFFDDEAFVGSPFASDKSALLAALQGVASSGGTNLDAGLIAAAKLLQGSPNTTAAQPVIIILTDGGADNPDDASQTAQQLAAGHVRLITIGLGQANDVFLVDLVAQPGDFHDAATPSDLQEIYSSLATEISPAIATNVTLTETVSPAFAVVTQTVMPPVDTQGNRLVWRTAALLEDHLSLEYAVSPRSLGLHTLNEEATMLTYTDCLHQAVLVTLQAGPTLIALPSTSVLALLAALTLLMPIGLLLFGGGRFNKSGREQLPAPGREPGYDTQPPPDPIPAWIKHLDEKKVLTLDREHLAAGDLAPTVIIGIGPIGRFVLSQVGQLLRSRYGPTLPQNVRLLQIDVHDRSTAQPLPERPTFLEPAEWVLLTPHLTEIGDSVQRYPQDWPHLDWYNGAQPDYDRARGRLALFDDLKDGADSSRLWKSLSSALQGLPSPKLRVVGSTFDDVSSGVLIDIARLLQIIRGASEDVELWLTGPVGEDWSERLHDPRRKVRASEQIARTLATLRELERFQRNARTPFHYVTASNAQDQLYGEVNAAVVQTIFLFEKGDPKMSVADHLTSLADALLATLHNSTQQVMDRLLTSHRATAFEIVNREQMGMACTLATYAVRMPGGPIERALAWRMLYDLLFEQRLGLLPQAQLDEDGSYIDYDPEKLLRKKPEEQAAEQAEIGNFVKANRRRLLTPEFYAVLAHRVSDLLNGEGNGVILPELGRAGGLIKARRWLRALKNELSVVEPEAVQVAERLRHELEEWSDFLTETVHLVVRRQLEESQRAIQALAGQTGRVWVMQKEGEWPIYKSSFRPWTTGEPGMNTSGEPLLRAAGRFGWQVVYDEIGRRWQVTLVAPPSAYIWQDEPEDVERYMLPREVQPFLQALYPYTQALAGNGQTDYVLKLASALTPSEWVARVTPSLRPSGEPINAVEASRLMGGNVTTSLLLVAPIADTAEQLRYSLATAPGAGTVAFCGTADPSAVTLLFLRGRVPLPTYRRYNQEAWEEVVLPSLYVWRGEQIAAQRELPGQRLNLEFVSWLQREPILIDLFAQAYLLDLVEQGAQQAQMPGLGKVRGGRVGELLAAVLGEDSTPLPDTLRHAPDKARALRDLAVAVQQEKEKYQQAPGIGEYVTWARENLIEPLRQDTATHGAASRERNFAIYLEALARRWEKAA